MKRILTVAMLLLAVALYAKPGDSNLVGAVKGVNGEKQKMAVIDVMSSSFEKAKIRMLTDNIRSALFNLRAFEIVERGAVQKSMQDQGIGANAVLEDSDVMRIGKTMNVDKVFVCAIEKFNTLISVNVRIINVETLLLDYTDNFYLRSEDQLLDAISEMVKKIEDFYVGRNRESLNDPAKRWSAAGADKDDSEWLLANRADPDEYWGLRQFDIRFTPAEYMLVKRGGLDVQAVRRFLQAGIPYNQVKRAITMGIVDVTTWRENWRNYGLSFEDYLNAYENGITSATDYKEYMLRFKKDRFIIGGGFITDHFPMFQKLSFTNGISNITTNSWNSGTTTNYNVSNYQSYTWLAATVGWEHFWTRNQRDWYKISGEVGLHLLMVFDPIPYGQLNFYFGNYPFYGKIALGAFYEFMLLGHYAAYLRAGMEVNESYEFTFMAIYGNNDPAGRLPSWDNFAPARPISQPYFGAMFTYKF